MADEGFKRKLAAILSADVKGYSLLMAEDEAATVRTLTAYREVMSSLIQQFRGRVVDTPGDNLLAEFASVVDAVQCAVEIQRVLKAKNAEIAESRRMEFRIGVNLGDVIEEGDRIYGDGVNIAARIEGLAEAGGICISGTAYEHIENKLPLRYDYLGEHTVKNIHKPIRVYRAQTHFEAVPAVSEGKKLGLKRWYGAALILSAIIVVGAAAIAIYNNFWRSAAPPAEISSDKQLPFPLPIEPSIAVMPFENLSGDPKEEYVVDALSENVIAVLSKTPHMIVSARNSTFAYKGKPVTVQQVAEELGVRNVLEGSVLKSGNRLRITAQLIDATTGNHLWTEQYEPEAKDLFHLLDTITRKITLELQVKLTLGEQARRWASGTDHPKAWNLVSQGINLIWRLTKENNAKAREFFEKALEIDPDYAVAIVWLAITHMLDVVEDWTEQTGKSYKLSLKQVQKALDMDDSLPLAHAALAEFHKGRGQYEKAIAEGEKAVALGPNHGLVQVLLANILAESGRLDQAIPLFKKALSLEPYYPAIYLQFLGEAYLRAQRHEEALRTWKEGLKRSRKAELPPHIPLIGMILSCMELGQEEEARTYAKELFRLKPSFSLTGLANVWKLHQDRNQLETLWVRFRKAGIVPPLVETAKEFRYEGPPSFVLKHPMGVTQTKFSVPEKVFEVETDDEFIEFLVFVEDIPTGMGLDDVGPKVFVPKAERNMLTKLVVLSNEAITLQNGTKAYKTKVEWMHRKGFFFTGLVISAFKGGKWVYLLGHTVGDPKEIEVLVESLRFVPNYIPIRAYVQHVLPAESISWTMIDIEIGEDFKDDLPDGIDTITVTGPNGDLPFSKKDFYWLPYWRSFWIGAYGIPETGTYKFTVTSGNRSGTGADTQTVVRNLPIPDTNTFTPAKGETLNSKAPTFSWGPVEAEGPVFYLLEINDHWGIGEVVYWGGYVEDMLSAAIPSGTLSPGKSYKWRVRVADHSDEVKIDNIAWSEWLDFTMAQSLE